MRKINLFVKRIIDIVGSIVAIIIFSPLMLIISIYIFLSSQGPIFFYQERLGKDGRIFRIIKFRTMVENAENMGDGLKIKSEGDSRITRGGRFLRKTSLDELPQFFNVIKGEMSLVGPRPPVVYFPYDGYDNYPEWAKNRFSMRPGITGLAQVTVRNSVPWDDRIRVDNEYIEGCNIFLDIKILFSTIIRVFKDKNIYLNKDQ